MPNPYSEHGIVIEFTTNEPSRFIQIQPNRLPGDQWLHDPDEFDRTQSREQVIDRYVLPPSDQYEVRVVEVPAGNSLQMGDKAGSGDQSGGGNLVELLNRDNIPESWVIESMTLNEYLE